MRVACLLSSGWPSPGGPPAGWEVVSPASVEALVELLSEDGADAALVRLSGDPSELNELLSRARVAAPGVPVVVAASAEDEEAAAAAVLAGAADYWLESMSGLRLRTTVEQAVGRRRSGSAQRGRDEALERVNDAVVVTDADERIVYWNQAASRLYGYAYPEVVGRLLPETLSPVWLDAETRLKAWRAVASNGVWLGVVTHARRDGSPVKIALELSSVRDARGRHAGLLLVAREADAVPSGAAPAGRDPRDVRQFLERIVNGVSDPVFVKDRGHRILFCNDAFCSLMALRREEILGRGGRELLPPAEAEVVDRQDDLVFESGRETFNEELITDAQGRTRVIAAKKTLGRGPDGAPILIGVLRDVTDMITALDELRRSQEQLRHAQKLEAVGRLAGGVAHDFNNILTAIVGCANLLLEGLPPGHACREDAEDIKRAGEQATTLTRQLLAFSRREEGLPRVVDLRETFGGMRKMLQRLLPADIELEMEMPDRLGAIRVDPGQAEQVLLNLVVNAGDAMPDGGRVTVTLADAPDGGGGVTGPCVRLSVSDTGMGMDEPTRRKIFDPFFTTKSGGTGLGLAMVRDVVTQRGGAVAVESEPGRGSAFPVFWPRCAEAAQPGAGAGARGVPRAPRRACVLLIEDDDNVRRFAVRGLERAGYAVQAAADGAEALRISDANEGLFDVVVIDVVLPRVRGTDVAARLRPRQPTARVLYVSGYRTDPATLPPLPYGRPEFLQKPFTAAELAEKVRGLLGPAASAPGL